MADEQGAIPEGMVAWHGGDAAPADWDGGPVLFREGHIGEAEGDSWMIGYGGPDPKPSPYDIIAYTPAADRLTDIHETLRKAATLLETLSRVARHRTIDPNVPLGRDIVETVERLNALATPKPPVDAGTMRERCAQVAESVVINVPLTPGCADGASLARNAIVAAIRNLPDAGEPL